MSQGFDWKRFERQTPEPPPLPDGVEILAQPQAVEFEDEQFLILSAFRKSNDDERSLAHPDRRHAFVSIHEISTEIRGDKRPYCTMILGMAGPEILLLRQVRAPRMPFATEFMLQTQRRTQWARQRAAKRVSRRLQQMQITSFVSNPEQRSLNSDCTINY